MKPAHITICVPYHRALPYIAGSVESLLTQTFKDICVVVVNDGDTSTPPWPALAHLTDRRLIRYDLGENRGPYFIHDLVLKTCGSPYFSVQDADDRSHPERLEILLKELITRKAAFAFSAEKIYRETPRGLSFDSIRWQRANVTSVAPKFAVDSRLTSEFSHHASHHALFRSDALLALGGYYGGFSMNYDCLLTNVLLMLGKMAYVETPLYEYILRSDSLSNSSATGAHSPVRKKVKAQQAALYARAFDYYNLFLTRQLTATAFTQAIRRLLQANIDPEATVALERYKKLLSSHFKSQPHD